MADFSYEYPIGLFDIKLNIENPKFDLELKTLESLNPRYRAQFP